MNAINKLKRISEIERDLEDIRRFLDRKEFNSEYTVRILSYSTLGPKSVPVEILVKDNDIGKEFSAVLEKYAHKLWVERDTLVDQYLDYIANQTLPKV